jgi:hypothetical protein
MILPSPQKCNTSFLALIICGAHKRLCGHSSFHLMYDAGKDGGEGKPQERAQTVALWTLS